MREARHARSPPIEDRAAGPFRKLTYVTLCHLLPYPKTIAQQQLLRPNFVIADFHMRDSDRAELSPY